jgi:hypothetical protein
VSIQQVADEIRTKNEARFNKFYKQENFEVGDKVRVKMAAFQSTIRQKKKEGNQKLVVVQFSPEIYEIQSIRPVKQGQFGYPLYILKDSQDRIIRYANNNPRPFNSGDLLKVGRDTPAYIDLTRANYLNRNIDGEDILNPKKSYHFPNRLSHLSENQNLSTPGNRKNGRKL